MNFEEEFKILLSSQHSLVYIVSDEEERLEYTISQIFNQEFNNSIYSWDFIDGYQNNPNHMNKAQRNPIEALEFIETLTSNTPKIFILKDFHVFMNDIAIIRKIKNIRKILHKTNSYVIVSAPIIQIPSLLSTTITVIEFPLPNTEEIEAELKRLFAIMSMDISINNTNLTSAYKGFSIERIRRSISKLVYSQKSIQEVFKSILEEKKQLIQQTDILDFYYSNHNLEDIGGLTNLKEWLKKRSNSFSTQAKNYGLPYPKGILLVGIQGTGKSLIAKAISHQWNIPLLRLDIGKIFTGIVGESEKRIRKMIKISEQSAPCILWIDEIDKAFTRFTSNTDSGTTNRVLSSFLTWLSEKETQVFVVATANNALSLPSELLRKGRFDEIFFLDLPNYKERLKIFQIHLMKVRPLTWERYDIKNLSELTDKFSGAEISQLIIEAMHNAFYEKREFNTQDIVTVIQNFVPLSFTDEGSISALQDWARLGKVRLASEENR
uniref:AAA domain-containing protein Ycf46 n=1 Tax=Grateloupia turuturu TaxID=118375 RepID=UPI0021D5321B|nr:AAA domain-containing protein Ycf46 [Grateloupia turuturu]UXC96782.1 AAA domain-containing protein Ycf46 [Grateloupia turuturu]